MQVKSIVKDVLTALEHVLDEPEQVPHVRFAGELGLELPDVTMAIVGPSLSDVYGGRLFSDGDVRRPMVVVSDLCPLECLASAIVHETGHVLSWDRPTCDPLTPKEASTLRTSFDGKLGEEAGTASDGDQHDARWVYLTLHVTARLMGRVPYYLSPSSVTRNYPVDGWRAWDRLVVDMCRHEKSSFREIKQAEMPARFMELFE